MWACPHCRLDLQASADGSSQACVNGHAFDRAREGYVNLLPSNRKRSREPGDSADMVAARRRVHDANTYRQLADTVAAELGAVGVAGRVLDLGCGEGYYAETLIRELPASSICGVDISRAAIRLAARRYPAGDFAVASAFDLPIPDASLGAVVRVFAPSDDGELLRVLKSRCFYLEVSPGPRHLWQLRQGLYEQPREHAVARSEISGLQLLRRRELHFEVNPGPGQLADIIGMTPFAHRGHRARREHVLLSALSAVTMAFSLRLFQRAS
jgi:23S rRNA (guanine745-N1)-methyltransferase